MNDFSGRVALVTGAASGIGQETAVKLAAYGADVVLVDLADCEETMARMAPYGRHILAVQADISREDEWLRVRLLVEQQFGRADILVNNAGIYPIVAFADLDYALFSHVLRTNLDGGFLGCKAFVPMMVAQKWGRIINVVSNSIASTIPGLSHYMASKMGVIGLTRGLANDLAKEGVTVNAIAPSITRTPGTSGMVADLLDAAWQMQAIKRFAVPDDIVGPILFLASEESRFVTGQTIVVDGGYMRV